MAKGTAYPAICGDCMEVIDWKAAAEAYKAGSGYWCLRCGRVLVRAK